LKVAITGANGWIGSALKHSLGLRQIDAIEISRSELQSEQALVKSLAGCSTVIHLAALVHQMDAPPTLEQFRAVNRDLTLSLAKAAALAGVEQLIFVSTAKVLGEVSVKPLDETAAANPSDDYARTKLEAEQGLQRLLSENALAQLKICIVRPPLVFGPGVKANYAKLVAIANSRWPLPLGAVRGKRSMVSLADLTELMIRLVERRSELSNIEIFHIATLPDKTSAQIIADIRKGGGRSPGLVAVPEWLMKLTLTCLGKRSIYDRLFTQLQINTHKAERFLTNSSSQSTGDKSHP
jgi:nucleoside-diphosphate-sugar epimerase